MKELIEKIKEIISIWNPLADPAYDKALYDVLDIIETLESKEFNPCELGFKNKFDSDRESIFYKTMNNRIIFDKTKELYSIDVYKFNIYSELKNIKIPNHRFGVELLRNLGVID